MKKIIIMIALLLMIRAGSELERYTLTVTAGAETITGTNTAGELVELTPCYTADGDAVLLEDVKAGHTYRVKLDRNETHNTEDDAIISIKEVQR